MVGRQRGNVLDLTEEGGGLIRGEEFFRRYYRVRPCLSLTRCEPWELVDVMCGLLVAGALCLFPATLMLQKRGRLRAVVVAVLVSVLLSTLMASPWLLLPFAGANLLSWAYTLGPVLPAALLLYVACRKSRRDRSGAEIVSSL